MLREINEKEMMMVSGGMYDPPPGGPTIPGTELWDVNDDKKCEASTANLGNISSDSIGAYFDHFANGGTAASWYRNGAGGQYGPGSADAMSAYLNDPMSNLGTFDWANFWTTLGSIAVGSVGGAGISTIRGAGTLVLGSGLAVEAGGQQGD